MILTATFDSLDVGDVARMMGVPSVIANSSLAQSLANSSSGNRMLANMANSYLSKNNIGIAIDNISMPNPLELRVEIGEIDHELAMNYLYDMFPDKVKANPQYAGIFTVIDSGDCSKRMISGICGSMSSEELDLLITALFDSFRPNLINATNRKFQKESARAALKDIRIDTANKPFKPASLADGGVIYL